MDRPARRIAAGKLSKVKQTASMSVQVVSPVEELFEFVRFASEARGLQALVAARQQLRAALRRALASRQWEQLDEIQRELAASPALAARFAESLHGVLEMPELGAREFDTRWHGLVLAIPLTLGSRAGTLVHLPEPLALALRESLQARLPNGTGIRLRSRPVPQLVAHAMDARSLYEFIEALASGGRDAAAVAGAAPSPFIPHGRSLGRHYLFALAVTADPGQLALEMAGGQHADPGLVKWAAAQTERITSDFAERGWPLIVRVSPPQRLREMLSSPPVLGDVRELDAFLAEVASRHETPVTMLRATLAVRSGEEPGLRIAISDRSAGRPLARAVYRIVGPGAEAGAYRVAVRLASAGVELVAAEESLLRVVQRALALTDEPEPAEVASRDRPESGSLRPGTMRSRFSRPTRHP